MPRGDVQLGILILSHTGSGFSQVVGGCLTSNVFALKPLMLCASSTPMMKTMKQRRGGSASGNCDQHAREHTVKEDAAPSIRPAATRLQLTIVAAKLRFDTNRFFLSRILSCCAFEAAAGW